MSEDTARKAALRAYLDYLSATRQDASGGALQDFVMLVCDVHQELACDSITPTQIAEYAVGGAEVFVEEAARV